MKRTQAQTVPESWREARTDGPDHCRSPEGTAGAPIERFIVGDTAPAARMAGGSKTRGYDENPGEVGRRTKSAMGEKNGWEPIRPRGEPSPGPRRRSVRGAYPIWRIRIGRSRTAPAQAIGLHRTAAAISVRTEISSRPSDLGCRFPKYPFRRRREPLHAPPANPGRSSHG